MDLKIGFNPAFAPFSMLGPDGPRGSVIEPLIALLRTEPCRWMPVALQDGEARLLVGEVDALVPVAVTPDRRVRMRFSRPLATTSASIFVRADDRDGSAAASADLLRIVTPAAGPFATRLAEHFADADIEMVGDYEEALERVVSRRADGAALNSRVGEIMARERWPGRLTRLEPPFAVLELALAVRPGSHASLLDRLADGWHDAGGSPDPEGSSGRDAIGA